jgi:dienelactone hydrolase
MTGSRALLLAGFVAMFAGSLHAAEPANDKLSKPQATRPDPLAELKSLLGHPILDSKRPQEEVAAYCEARVPAMPKVETAAAWEAEAQRLRQAVLDRVVFRGEAARWRDALTKVQWLDTIPGGPGYRIKKLRYEALPGLWIPALLYEPEKLEGRVPVVLNVNGHDGVGKAAAYKQIRCINQAKRGLLALNVEWLGMGQLAGPDMLHYRMNQLDLCGTSGLAPFYLAMKRGIDVLLSLEHADPTRVAVAGMSGGGWQTIFISSLDTRVTLANPVAGYSSFRTRARYVSDLGDSEQTPSDLATVVDYIHLTAMRAPRPTLLTFNSKDNCCFASGHALPPLLEGAGPVFQLLGRPDVLRSHINDDPGTHNFEQDNREAFYRMLGDSFYKGQPFDAKEIPCPNELKTKEELAVELPAKNETFHSLALTLAANLPRQTERPTEQAAATAWQAGSRARLQSLTRVTDYPVVAESLGTEKKGEIQATYWKLKMDNAWTVPAVELARGNATKTVLLVADAGRADVAADVQRLLDEGLRVVAIDPFFFGESKIAERDFLYALLVAAVGDRPLGLQASQVAATARWLASRPSGPVKLLALGPRSSLYALVAAGIENQAVGEVELHGSLGSLKEVIEQNWSVDLMPEMFCFGLLEAFDVKHLAALVVPRRLTFVDVSDRLKGELGEVDAWYRLFSIADAPVVR